MDDDLPDEIERTELDVAKRKGTLLVLLAIATSDSGLRHFEVEEKTQLPRGTVHDALKDLWKIGWIRQEAQLDEAGLSAKFFRLDNEAKERSDPLENVGQLVFRE